MNENNWELMLILDQIRKPSLAMLAPRSIATDIWPSVYSMVCPCCTCVKGWTTPRNLPLYVCSIWSSKERHLEMHLLMTLPLSNLFRLAAVTQSWQHQLASAAEEIWRAALSRLVPPGHRLRGLSLTAVRQHMTVRQPKAPSLLQSFPCVSVSVPPLGFTYRVCHACAQPPTCAV